MPKPARKGKPRSAAPQPSQAGARLGDQAYEAVLDAISAGELKPGDRVSEYAVANWLNVSRTPAREALQRLENEGVLTSHAQRGLVVATIDSHAIFELYAAREALEGTAAAFAASRASDAEIALLQHMVEAEAGMFGDPKRMYQHNREFHGVLYRAAHNRYLLKFLLALADVLSAQRNPSTLGNEERRRAVLVEHRAIVDAIAAHDARKAQEAASKHVRGALAAATRMHFQQLAQDAARSQRREDAPPARREVAAPATRARPAPRPAPQRAPRRPSARI